jgi:ankyrin repeat protein
MSGDLEMVQVLLDNDADVNSRNEYGSSSLIVASNYVGPQSLHIVRLLLDNGANPNVWTSIRGTTPLHAASYRGNLEVVRLLLEYGADVERKNKEDRTPFEVALEGRHHEVALFLSFHGARHI